MPALIVAGPSNPKEGKIGHHDLIRIIEDFQNHVVIDSTFERQALKVNNILIPIEVLRALLKKSDDPNKEVDNYINIQFGLTIPGQKDCNDDFKTDISNQLTIVVNRAKEEDGTIFNRTEVGDIIITMGFKSSLTEFATLCCGKPGG